jgi:hypothetical protein
LQAGAGGARDGAGCGIETGLNHLQRALLAIKVEARRAAMDQQQRQTAVGRKPYAVLTRRAVAGDENGQQRHSLSGGIGRNALRRKRTGIGIQQPEIVQQSGVQAGSRERGGSHIRAQQIAIAPDEILHAGERCAAAIRDIDKFGASAQIGRQSLAQLRQHGDGCAGDGQQNEMRGRAMGRLRRQHLLRHRRAARQERLHIRAELGSAYHNAAEDQAEQPDRKG